ncbi:MAG: hypothetical protein V7L25_14520 [Nostoc sp.]|uniref:hypothetical protein n=1 Tax=Nostoc sp. TaxID=1180 RepID=UPI002FF0106D
MNKVRLALMMLILLGSIFASKNLMAIPDASRQLENRKLNQIRNQTVSKTLIKNVIGQLTVIAANLLVIKTR